MGFLIISAEFCDLFSSEFEGICLHCFSGLFQGRLDDLGVF